MEIYLSEFTSSSIICLPIGLQHGFYRLLTLVGFLQADLFLLPTGLPIVLAYRLPAWQQQLLYRLHSISYPLLYVWQQQLLYLFCQARAALFVLASSCCFFWPPLLSSSLLSSHFCLWWNCHLHIISEMSWWSNSCEELGIIYLTFMHLFVTMPWCSKIMIKWLLTYF